VGIGATGIGFFTYTFPSFGMPTATYPYVTATATDAKGNTSEFSAPLGIALPPGLSPSGMDLNATAGTLFNGPVATFTAAYAIPVSDFTVTIQWGDGSTSTGAVVQTSYGYTVVGSHTYLSAAPSVPVTVTIDDVLANVTVMANSTMTVAGGDTNLP
jgi:hypothetical protein